MHGSRAAGFEPELKNGLAKSGSHWMWPELHLVLRCRTRRQREQEAEVEEPDAEANEVPQQLDRPVRNWRRLVQKARRFRFWQRLWHWLGEFLQEGEYTRTFRRRLGQILQ